MTRSFLWTGVRLAALCSLLLLAACGGKQIPPRDGIPSPHLGTIRDMRSFPQDLTVFAQQAGADTPLLDSQAQAEQDARFNRIFFGPWDMRKTSIRKRDVEIYFRKAKGYKYGDVRWTQDEWDAMRANAGLKSFPNTAMYGITVRNADLREMPSHTPRFSEPTPDPRINPFDYFQYSLLPVGTPVFIAHTSRDGNWYYVETPVAAGWVDANDIGIVDEAFEASYKTGSYVAVLRDNVPLPGSLAGQVNIGTVVTLTLAHEDAAIKPLPMTPAQVALIGNVMMGQRYGWGGMFGDRDCSALTRELLTPFGIWLPRNSLSQARSGRRIMLDGMSIKEKEKAILRDGVPFLTLVWLRGHIMLYVGPYKGRPAIFHNVWGVRTVEGASDNERFVIGRAVVSSITPGSELRNLYRTTTFGDRVNSITVLGGR